MGKNILLEETQAAWQELLCLQSWHDELPSDHERYEELVHRLLAAEKWHQHCLRRLQEAGVYKIPVPYSDLSKRRKIKVNGHWYHWR